MRKTGSIDRRSSERQNFIAIMVTVVALLVKRFRRVKVA